MRRRIRPLVLVSLAALLPGAPSIAAASRTHVVVIDKMTFGAVPAGIRPGDTIVWVNRDMVRHTATARDGSFNLDLAAGARGKTIVKKGGAVPFYCKYHAGMRGVMRVAVK